MPDIPVDDLRPRQPLNRGGTRIRVDPEDASPCVDPRAVDMLVLDERGGTRP